MDRAVLRCHSGKRFLLVPQKLEHASSSLLENKANELDTHLVTTKNSFNIKVLCLCPAALPAILSLLGVFVSDKKGLVFANENVLVAGDNR